ncbi:MAG: flagellar hook assembly protein FlgD [Spirochaetota bacterium]
MDFSALLSPSERSKVQMQVDLANASIGNGRAAQESLGKDDFLKILITQLTHQDPTAPMEDKDFVAQMAQFSSLEQIANMSREFSRLANVVSVSRAISLLGKNVEIVDGNTTITGLVEEVAGKEYPQLLINGKYYDYSKVEKVKE